jgi:predicted Zn-dependent protease
VSFRRRLGVPAAILGLVLLSGAVVAHGLAQSAASKKQSSGPAGAPAFQRIAKEAAQARDANRINDAVGLYQHALKLNPRWDEGWWYLGTLYYDSDRYAEGVKAFRNLVEISPHYGSAWALLGLCEFEMKDYKNSFIHLQKGRVEGLGDNKDLIHVTRYHQAVVEILNGNFEDANSLLSSLVTENVLSNDVKLALGLALLHVPLLPNQIDPSKDALISAAGNIGELEALNDFDEAKKAFERLIHDYPTTPFVHYSYGAMLAELSQYQEAEQQLLEEIKINRNSSMPYMQLAYVYIRVNQFNDALPTARQAVQLVPESFAAHYLLGRTLLGLGQVNESIKELTIAKRLGPYSPEVRYNLARALARAKRTREAAQEQAEFARLDALVERARQKSQPQSYRESGERGDLAPRQGQAPSGAALPQ